MDPVRHTLTIVSALLCLTFSGLAEELSQKLQQVSVTVHAGRAQGSGVLITRDNVNYVLTAGHVVDGLRTVMSFSDNESGGTKKFAKFSAVKVVKELYQDGRSVGTSSVEGEVIAYSSAEWGHDLALIKLRTKIADASAQFYLGEAIPANGTKLAHVGSLLGQDGSNSYTTGVYAQQGRVLFDHVFDQTTCSAFPGSSGGGVYLEATGEYIGCLVRGAGETFNLIVPVRRIKEWASAHKVEFILDPAKPVDLKAVKLELLEPASDSAEPRYNYRTFQAWFPTRLFQALE